MTPTRRAGAADPRYEVIHFYLRAALHARAGAAFSVLSASP